MSGIEVGELQSANQISGAIATIDSLVRPLKVENFPTVSFEPALALNENGEVSLEPFLVGTFDL